MTDEQAETEAEEYTFGLQGIPQRPAYEADDPPAYEWERHEVEPPASPFPKAVTRWLTGGEVPVIVTRQHVARLIPPAAALLAGLALAAWISLTTPPAAGHLAWWAFLAVTGWAAWRWLDWRQCWIIVTPKRIMNVYGVARLRLEQLPLAKLRDVDLSQTIPGRVFGYGTFEFSSIATGHSLQQVEYVPWPADTHVEITAMITRQG